MLKGILHDLLGEEKKGEGQEEFRRKAPAFSEPVEKDEEEKILAALSYLFGPPGAMVLYLAKPQDKFLRFHCIQSILFWLAGLFVFFVLVALIITAPVAPVVLVLILGWAGYLMYHAERGEWEKVPFIGDYAEENC